MNAPTLYYLIFKDNGLGEYDVYEQHTCQEKGCIMTEEAYITTCLPGKIDEFVDEYDKELLKGRVEGYSVDHYIKEGQ